MKHSSTLGGVAATVVFAAAMLSGMPRLNGMERQPKPGNAVTAVSVPLDAKVESGKIKTARLQKPSADTPRFVRANNATDVRKKSSSVTTAVGCIVSSYDSSLELGIYEIPLDGSDYRFLGTVNPICNNGVLIDDVYLTTTVSEFQTYHEKYDTKTWDSTWWEEATDYTVSTDMAYDPVTGKTYGCFTNWEGGYEFGEFLLNDFWRSEICALDEPWYGLAVNTSGVLYAITGDGKLYTVDKATGDMTLTGETGLVADSFASAVCDPATGDIYYTPMINGTSYLYKIDPATAEAEFVTIYGKGERITGLCPLTAGNTPADDALPSAVTGLKAAFEGASLSGTVSFKAPVTNTDGTDGSGNLTYEIQMNGTHVASGSTTYGGDVSESVTVSEAGNYTFSVTVANAAGSSEPAKVALWIGEQAQGAIEPPYTNTFDDNASLDGFTRLNINDDGQNWDISGDGRARMTFSSDKDMDAWLITPALKLDSDKFYSIELDAACAHSNYPERLEVFAGSSALPEGMTIRILDKTDIGSSTGTHLKGYLHVEADGVYYVGIHGCSDKDQYYLLIDNLSINVGAPASSPQAISDLAVTPDALGGLSAEITFTAPTKDINGSPLSSLDKIELYRGDDVVKTFNRPAPGESLSYTDTPESAGTYTYTVIPYNESGRGIETTATTFVGINVPAAPTNARIEENSTPGEVTVSWDAPSVDKDGNPINAALIKYTIVDAYTRTTIVDGLTDTRYVFQAVPSITQDFVQYGIFAYTGTEDISAAAMTPIYPVGKAYALPVAESFANGEIENDYVWGNEAAKGSSAWWELLTDSNGVFSQDGDNGYVGSFAQDQYEAAYLYTGKINTGKAENPALSFYYYKFKDGENTIDVSVDDGESLKLVATVECGPESEGWTRAVVPLSEYKDKDIRICFTTTSVSHQATVLDNISIFDQPVCDIAATRLGVPVKTNVGNPVILISYLTNNGSSDIKEYFVELYRNGKVAQTYKGENLASGKDQMVAFYEQPGLDSEPKLEYYVTVTCEGDEVESNNSTEKGTMLVALPNYPAPSGLTADKDGSRIELTWNGPDLTDLPGESKTDDFETYESFAIDNAGDWTFIDADKGETYGYSYITFPNTGEPMAYMVFDNTDYAEDPMLAAHSGHKFLASMCSKNAPNDDWLISPELDGRAQTITFNARAAISDYAESFEFLYSSTGTNMADFVKVGEQKSLPDTWTEYLFNVPEGARYFAIRCTSDDALTFMVDDVTYVAADAPQMELEFVGYNVYRDGVAINGAPLTDERYTDSEASDGHRYFVTAVYDRGESVASNVVDFGSVGIMAPEASSIGVKAGKGRILVTGAKGLSIGVYTPDGRSVFSGDGSEVTYIGVSEGVYIVKAGNKAVKVLVR